MMISICIAVLMEGYTCIVCLVGVFGNIREAIKLILNWRFMYIEPDARDPLYLRPEMI